MNISYSTTIQAWVWHYSIVPSQFGKVEKTERVTPPDFRTGPIEADGRGRYSDTTRQVEWVEAKLAEKNTSEQQERFLVAQNEYSKRFNREQIAQIERYGAN